MAKPSGDKRLGTLGPVQFVVIGLQNDKMKGEVARQIHAASEKGIIRVLDALAIQKTQDGDIVSLGATDLTPDQRLEYGAVVGALMGLGATGTEEGLEVGAEMGEEAFAEHTFGLSDDEIQDMASDIPAGMTAVFVLFEHRWALRLKDAIISAGGTVLAQGMVNPASLMLLGADLADASAAADQYEMTQSGPAH